MDAVSFDSQPIRRAGARGIGTPRLAESRDFPRRIRGLPAALKQGKIPRPIAISNLPGENSRVNSSG
jgi:hypothetical protein